MKKKPEEQTNEDTSIISCCFCFQLYRNTPEGKSRPSRLQVDEEPVLGDLVQAWSHRTV